MLRWSLLLLVLAIVEGTLGPSSATGSPAIAKISFIMAVGLFILYQRASEHNESALRKT